MASLPQYYSDYIWSNEFGELPTPIITSSSEDGSSTASVAMHAADQETLLPVGPAYINGAVSTLGIPFDSSDIISCSSSMSLSSSPMAAALFFPAADRSGASDMMSLPSTLLPTSYDSKSSGLLANISENEDFISAAAGDYCHQHDLGDQECSLLPSNFWPLYPTMTCENWEIQGGTAQRIEEPTLKIAPYSPEERKDRILRYLKKRSQRNFNKTIKYACRKTLADKRVRVRGRFAKNNDCCEDDEILVVKTDYINLHEEEPCYNINNIPYQMKAHEEEWLQEDMAGLMYYRVLPANVLEFPDKY
ncbi:hypothetical protein ACH5RR_038185 [Cinchona calisaya]|uniref:CCT domain-containing protein n=1 Tax=Cinchona calisaya TaxID=153742 RepID=A0ABD2Y8D6_9GENT